MEVPFDLPVGQGFGEWASGLKMSEPPLTVVDAAGEAEARALFRRAQQAHDSENFGEAAAMFRQLYHRTDLPPRIHRLMLRNLGISLYRLGNIEEALVFLNMYIAQRR